jgi:putative ABC transport system substrate-binding protein
MIRRREFITLVCGSAAWPLAARAQQAAMPVIGFLDSTSNAFPERLTAFREGLAEGGFVEGHNATVEYRWAGGQYDRLPALADDLVRRRVDVIAAPDGISSAQAAKAATNTIPIVFAIATDPVQAGLVASLSRPGGNLTGAVSMNVELASKRLQLLHELVPTADRMALLVNPENPNANILSRDMEIAARNLSMDLRVLHASTEHDLDTAFAAMVQLQVGGLVIGADPFFLVRSERLAAQALSYSIPSAYSYRSFAAAGGLMSYAGSFTEGYRLVGLYTGRVLKGEKPADLPVQQYTKLEMFINLKTAKALGLTVPPSLFAIADEVIE